MSATGGGGERPTDRSPCRDGVQSGLAADRTFRTIVAARATGASCVWIGMNADRIRAAALAAMLLIAPAALGEEAPPGPAERARIEGVVRDYLLRHPEVLIEALDALKEKNRIAEEAAARKTLASRRAEIFDDPKTPVAGNPDGDVVLVEFFDYRCGVCRKTHPVVAELMRGDPNIRRVYKEWPILGAESQLAARAALAARYQGDAGYAAFHDALMEAPPRFTEAIIPRIAAKVGLDADRLAKDMQRPEIAELLARNFRLAEALGLRGTPSYVIGEQIIHGGRELADLQAIVKHARRAAGN